MVVNGSWLILGGGGLWVVAGFQFRGWAMGNGGGGGYRY